MKRELIIGLQNLNQKSEEVSTKSSLFKKSEAQLIIKDLEDSLDLKKGVGLSAIQIGILKRVSIIRFGKFKLDLINPIILAKENKIRFPKEGCLSLPNLFIDTMRYNNITLENNGKVSELSGLPAVMCQHEIDHLNGLTILNRKWRKR